MKNCIQPLLLLVALLCIQLPAHSQTEKFNLSAEEWRADLDWLSETVHDEYAFLFKKISPEDWDAQVAALRRDIPDMEEHQIIVGMAEVVASFGWGHTRMDILPWGPDYNPAGFKRMPYNFYVFSDGIYVQGTHTEFKEAVGAKVIAIGGTPIEEALEKVRPAVPVENEQYFRAFGIQYLQVPEILHARGITEDMSETTLTLEKDGKRFDVAYPYDFQYRDPRYSHGLIFPVEGRDDWVVARKEASPEDGPLWLRHPDKHFWFTDLEGEKTVYAQQNLVRDSEEESIAEFYERLFNYLEEQEIEKLILDLRLNTGGNNFLNTAAIREIIKSDRIDRPGHFFVVIGRRTFSACQNYVNELEKYTEAIFVGEPTGENVNMYGDNREITLPNSGLTGRLSWAWWQDKAPWDDREWTEPMLAADLSFRDYMDNIDPVLRVIKELEETGDPREIMRALFDAGEMDELVEFGKTAIKNPVYRYLDFESDINRAGYQLLQSGRAVEAFEVFRLNTELYPESANVWDSYAEVHLEMDKIDEAVRLYKKAEAMDPDGFVGNNAREMLERIASFSKAHDGGEEH